MRPIEASDTTLVWEQVDAIEPRLVAGEDAVGSLRWVASRSSTAEAESASGRMGLQQDLLARHESLDCRKAI